MRRIIAALAVSVPSLCAVPAVAVPVTVFSSLGPGGTFGSAGDAVGAGSGREVIANAFTPGATGQLADVQLGLSTDPSGTLGVYLESDNSGAPGIIVDTMWQAGETKSSGSLVTFRCTTCSLLDAGTSYWIVTVDTAPNALVLRETAIWLAWLSGHTGTRCDREPHYQISAAIPVLNFVADAMLPPPQQPRADRHCRQHAGHGRLAPSEPSTNPAERSPG